MTTASQRPRSPETAGKNLAARLDLARSDGFRIDLELDVPAGRTVALLGPNGAGKSTTIEILAGLLAVDRGSVTLGDTVLDDPDHDVFVRPEARNIGVVFQDYLLFEHLTVADNVAFGPAARSSDSRRFGRRRHARAGIEEWLERFGLTEFADRKPSSLSGGQAQRVALARALASAPELLVLDEPLAALDVKTRTELRRSLASRLAEYSGPSLLITHEPADAFILADEICVIEGGRLTQRGTVDELRRRPATAYAAAVAGTNLFTGTSDRGEITVDRSQLKLRSSQTESGPVHAVVHPRAVSLHPEQPKGSQRNVWSTTVDWIEPLGETTRIQLGQPLPMVADITPSAAEALGLRPGAAVWAALKATEVSVRPR